MPTAKRPRRGSLQFAPRKRAAKVLPSANWKPITSESEGILGFITYKVGMASAVIKDSTEKVLSSGKRITLPVTILEAPNMKVLSVRFYKNSIPLKDFIVSNDKELKKKLKITKKLSTLDKIPEEYDDIRIIAYSLPRQTSIKKAPDLIELAVQSDNKLDYVKKLITKEISITDFIDKHTLLDTRGLTKGKGTQGPVKRFGITLRFSKSEKGIRKVGSIGPWHPARVTFRTPMAGQLGFFSRVNYNNSLITHGNIKEKDINPKSGFKHYGKINSSYLIIKGSVQGPAKRQILITPSYRPTKDQIKKKFEFVELINKTQ
jgi:large subunit ribosomal protein L3